MERKNTTFKQLIREFQELDRELSDTNMYGQEGMPMGDEEMAYADEPRHDAPEGESEEEKAMHASEVIQHEPIIGKIRETAIEGLRKYADHPTSPAYEFFKKVFLEADKVLVDNGKK